MSKRFAHKVIGKVDYPKGYEKLLTETMNKIKLYPWYIPNKLAEYINKNSTEESKKGYFLKKLRNKLTDNQLIMTIKEGKVFAFLNSSNNEILDNYYLMKKSTCKVCGGQSNYSETCSKCANQR